MYGHILAVKPISRHKSLTRGSLVSRWLAIYYYNKMKPHKLFSKVLNNVMFWVPKIQKELNYSSDDAFALFRVLSDYQQTYKEDNWKPIAVEKGFSKILYEDENNLFIYEGRPDLIASTGKEIIVVDHKTRSTSFDLYPHNNQVYGYLWAAQGDTFVYNYLTLTKTPKFNRAPFQFSKNQIQAWVDNTIENLFRLKADIERKKFPRTLNCRSVYGLCEYAPICEQPTEAVKLHILNSSYVKKKYRSW